MKLRNNGATVPVTIDETLLPFPLVNESNEKNQMAWKNATLQEKGCFVFQQNLTKVVACTERCSDNNVGALAKIRAFVRQSFLHQDTRQIFGSSYAR